MSETLAARWRDFLFKNPGLDLGFQAGSLFPFAIVGSNTPDGDPKVWKCLNDRYPLIPVKISLGANHDGLGVLFNM